MLLLHTSVVENRINKNIPRLFHLLIFGSRPLLISEKHSSDERYPHRDFIIEIIDM